jgi:hypothetical protein
MLNPKRSTTTILSVAEMDLDSALQDLKNLDFSLVRTRVALQSDQFTPHQREKARVIQQTLSVLVAPHIRELRDIIHNVIHETTNEGEA